VPSERDLPYLREVLVQELLQTDYIHPCNDFCRIATFLQCDRNTDTVLVMEELKRWPEAHAWLSGKLEN
jgi:hypothetical protein